MTKKPTHDSPGHGSSGHDSLGHGSGARDVKHAAKGQTSSDAARAVGGTVGEMVGGDVGGAVGGTVGGAVGGGEDQKNLVRVGAVVTPTPALAADTVDPHETLLHLLDEQLRLYRAILTVASTQATLAEGGHMGQLAELTEKRRPLVERLTQVAVAIEPFGRLWDRMSMRCSADVKQRTHELATQAQQVRAHVMLLDDQLRHKLVQSRADAASQMAHAKQTGSAARAYAAAAVASDPIVKSVKPGTARGGMTSGGMTRGGMQA